MKRPATVSIAAIVAIFGLEAIALANGINGTLFYSAVAAIAGIGGWSLHRRLGA